MTGRRLGRGVGGRLGSGIDLHCHSNVSDGTDSPAELVDRAAACGIEVLALTDHDTFDGLVEARAEADRVGLELVAGMEMSCGLGGQSVHLLAYGADPQSVPLGEELARLRAGREQRMPRMIAALAELGFRLRIEDVLEQVGGAPSIGRPHIADALVAAGYVTDRREAFDRLLGEGGPAYVDRYQTPLAQGIALIHRAGGVAVIAHPWGRGSRSVLGPDVLTRLVEDEGLDGFEVDHVDHGPVGSLERIELRQLAESLSVLGTGSSDYHGLGKPGLQLGVNTTSPELYAELRRRMGHPAG